MMTDQPDGGTRDIADDGTQENAEADGGAGSSYGQPGNVGGEQEPGGAVPPYDGRSADVPVKTDASDYNEGARVGGATGPVETSGESQQPDPTETPGGATASPADEQPAENEPDADEHDGTDPRDDPGVGPAHYPGTGRPEDHAS